MSGLIGQFEKPLDDKSRLVVPSELRRGLGGDELVLMRWFHRSLALFPKETWMAMAESINETGDYSEEALGARRQFYSRSRPVALDKQGRFLIPEDMRAYALMDRDVVLTGDWDKVLLWSRSRYVEMGMMDERSLDDQYRATLGQITRRPRTGGTP